jgi:hypothetical protein
MSLWFVSMTLRMAMSPMTGAEMVVTRRRMAAIKRKLTPTLFPRAMLAVPTRRIDEEGRRTNEVCAP